MKAEAVAAAHPNIALVKYWGKLDAGDNVPAVGSLSITLDALTTTTRVRFDDSLREDRFSLDGHAHPAGLSRVSRCLDLFRERSGVAAHAEVKSRNDFPTGAGLASSASGFAALVTAADRALESRLDRATLADLARRCSASAGRSLFGGFVEMGGDEELRGGAPPIRQLAPPDAWPLDVVVAITAAAEKEVGSTAGMERSALTSPYYPAWVESSAADLAAARLAVQRRDFAALAEVGEHSCLKMHAVMLASRPPLIYWNAATVACMRRVRDLRRRGVPVFFTIDAGPQLKAVCLPGAGDEVAVALAAVPGVETVLRSGLGEGARSLEGTAWP
jgi:diphosphomevalonate decarboxylase